MAHHLWTTGWLVWEFLRLYSSTWPVRDGEQLHRWDVQWCVDSGGGDNLLREEKRRKIDFISALFTKDYYYYYYKGEWYWIHHSPASYWNGESINQFVNQIHRRHRLVAFCLRAKKAILCKFVPPWLTIWRYRWVPFMIEQQQQQRRPPPLQF